MNKNLAQIEFYFPEGKFKDQKELIDETVSMMRANGSLKYSGFASVKDLKEMVWNSMGQGDIKNYRKINKKEEAEIEKIITDTIARCNKVLKIPTKNFVFVRPFFPDKNEDYFGGSMGLATYSCVFHIFVDLESYTKKSLEHTIAHEINHTIYMYHHYDEMMTGYTLLDKLVLEGLAESFREYVVGGKIAPWSCALSQKEALDTFKKMSSRLLKSQNDKTIHSVLYGDESKYKHWTGYSIGYWLVKEFMGKNKNLSWEELMRVDSKEFMKFVK